MPTSSSDIELLAQSKSKTIPERFCLRGSLTEAYLSSLSGMTLEHSQSTTQTHEATLSGSEEGTGSSSFVAGSPNFARTFQQPDAEKESQAHEADCGQKWRGLLAKYDHNSRSWKTAQCSLLGDLEQSLETWPRSGLMLNGVCYQRQTLARSICGKESGLSPDGVTTFHTPTTQGMNGGSNSRRALKKRMWTTPSASDAKRGGTITDNMTGTSLVQQFNTPAYWPTPTANGSKNSTLPVSQRNRDGMAGSLLRQGHQPGETLNPEWVEWLMNWPIGWTSLDPMNAENWERWKSANAAYFESNGAIETWCNNDPSESQHDNVPRVTTGVSSRAERLKALGNGQFPRTAAEAWDLLLAPEKTKMEAA